MHVTQVLELCGRRPCVPVACYLTHLACFNPDIPVAYILPIILIFQMRKLRLGGLLLQEVVNGPEELSGAGVAPCACFLTAHREAVYVGGTPWTLGWTSPDSNFGFALHNLMNLGKFLCL